MPVAPSPQVVTTKNHLTHCQTSLKGRTGWGKKGRVSHPSIRFCLLKNTRGQKIPWGSNHLRPGAELYVHVHLRTRGYLCSENEEKQAAVVRTAQERVVGVVLVFCFCICFAVIILTSHKS